jgi:DNA-binding MarR family transcriptional regulator
LSRLSDASVRLLKVIRDFPGQDGEQLKHQHFADSNQTGNNIKQLEKYGYIRYQEPPYESGWSLTVKGMEVLKYG